MYDISKIFRCLNLSLSESATFLMMKRDQSQEDFEKTILRYIFLKSEHIIHNIPILDFLLYVKNKVYREELKIYKRLLRINFQEISPNDCNKISVLITNNEEQSIFALILMAQMDISPSITRMSCFLSSVNQKYLNVIINLLESQILSDIYIVERIKSLKLLILLNSKTITKIIKTDRFITSVDSDLINYEEDYFEYECENRESIFDIEKFYKTVEIPDFGMDRLEITSPCSPKNIDEDFWIVSDYKDKTYKIEQLAKIENGIKYLKDVFSDFDYQILFALLINNFDYIRDHFSYKIHPKIFCTFLKELCEIESLKQILTFEVVKFLLDDRIDTDLKLTVLNNSKNIIDINKIESFD